MSNFYDPILWTGDHVYPCTIALDDAIPLPLKPVAEQRSWRDNIEARIRVALGNMLPEDERVIEGVTVYRTSLLKKSGGCALVYTIQGTNTRKFEVAVSAVLAAARERGAGS